jgi:protein-disulfide isomerase
MNQGVKTIMVGIVSLIVGAGGAVLALGATAAPADKVPVTDRAAIETIVREYILNHPEILPEAMKNLERKEASKRLSQEGDSVTIPFAGAWEGSANPDVTLVEFFDYACGYCRASRPDVDKLLAEDPKLRIVYRELPILGPPSDAAARASLAVAKIGGYSGFHRALFAEGRPSETAIGNALAKSGVDSAAVKALAASPQIDQEIRANLELQRSLNLTGTPSWIVGDQLLNGAVGYDELKAAIAEARAVSKGTQ